MRKSVQKNRSRYRIVEKGIRMTRMMKIIILLPELCQKRIFGVPGMLVSFNFPKHAFREKIIFLDLTDDGCVSSLVDFYGFSISIADIPCWLGKALTE